MMIMGGFAIGFLELAGSQRRIAWSTAIYNSAQSVDLIFHMEAMWLTYSFPNPGCFIYIFCFTAKWIWFQLYTYPGTLRLLPWIVVQNEHMDANTSCYTTLSSKQKLSADRYPACESPCLLLLAAFQPCVLVDREILAKLSDSQRFAIMEKDTGERRTSVTSRLPEKCDWTRLCMSVYLFLPRAGRQCYPDVAIRDRFWRGKYLGLIPLHKSPLVFLLFFTHIISTCLGRRILNQEHSFFFFFRNPNLSPWRIKRTQGLELLLFPILPTRFPTRVSSRNSTPNWTTVSPPTRPNGVYNSMAPTNWTKARVYPSSRFWSARLPTQWC